MIQYFTRQKDQRNKQSEGIAFCGIDSILSKKYRFCLLNTCGDNLSVDEKIVKVAWVAGVI